jgi:hypothetical protein
LSYIYHESLWNKLTIYKISQYPSLFYILSNLTHLVSWLASRNEPKRQARRGSREAREPGAALLAVGPPAAPRHSELKPAHEPRAYFLALGVATSLSSPGPRVTLRSHATVASVRRWSVPTQNAPPPPRAIEAMVGEFEACVSVIPYVHL